MALPTVVTSAGLTPRKPIEVRADLTARVEATNPGYTNNLPGGLIEDIASTDVAAILQSDQARVDAVNSLTPYGANAFLLRQLGEMFGIQLGKASNTSVYVQFRGTPGFVIGKGFVVSDGTYQYVVQDGGIIGEDEGSGTGISALLYAVSPTTGTWAVGSGTVTTLATSVPNTVTLSVTNPSAGLPSEAAETEESYRTRVMQAQLAASTGTQTLLKTLLNNIDGVQARLISIIQLAGNAGWEIIVGGGDPYYVGYAIFRSGIDLASIVGSELTISGITKANPGVATTVLNHGLTTGDVINIIDSNPSAWNVAGATVTVISPKTFSYGVNTSGFATYVSGAQVTPNDRNITVSLNDYPDTYSVTFVNPPQQSVTMTLTWNTSLSNFVSESAVAQAGAPALADYVNSIVVGQPINVFQMEEVFLAAIADIIDPTLVTRMIFSVSINGIGTPVTSGTGVIAGDAESYFLTTSSDITITQG